MYMVAHPWGLLEKSQHYVKVVHMRQWIKVFFVMCFCPILLYNKLTGVLKK